MPKPITVLVAGATGRQGGAVARLLLSTGHRVRALTRRPGSEAAERVRALGAEVHGGDLEDAASIRRAAAGADAFFLMTTPFQAGVDAEVRQGLRAAEGARDAGVKHLVYSSVASADRGTGVPAFDTKQQVEAHLRGLGIPWTVVAPPWFMENLFTPASLASLRAGTLALALPPGRSLHMIALADLAAMVRLALERPGDFAGRRVEIASDVLTGPEAARALAAATGTTFTYREIPLEAVRAQSEGYFLMWRWLAQVGHDTDPGPLRRAYPEVGWHAFRDWARAQDWTVLDVAGPEQPTA
jgi:uncharacterized protein YbjT (DUF2867 family)